MQTHLFNISILHEQILDLFVDVDWDYPCDIVASQRDQLTNRTWIILKVKEGQRHEIEANLLELGAHEVQTLITYPEIIDAQKVQIGQLNLDDFRYIASGLSIPLDVLPYYLRPWFLVWFGTMFLHSHI